MGAELPSVERNEPYVAAEKVVIVEDDTVSAKVLAVEDV